MCMCYHPRGGGGVMRRTSPINNSSCMLNFMCTALKNYFLLSKIRFWKSLRNQELFQHIFLVSVWTGSWWLKPFGKCWGYILRLVDTLRVSFIRPTLRSKNCSQRREKSVVKILRVFLLPSKRTLILLQLLIAKYTRQGTSGTLISKNEFFHCAFHHSLTLLI